MNTDLSFITNEENQGLKERLDMKRGKANVSLLKKRLYRIQYKNIYRYK